MNWNQDNNVGFAAQEVGALYEGTVQMYSPNEQPVICLYTDNGQNEMLRVAEDGFYVRGVKVPVDDNEALEVYKAFRAWMVWASLNKRY